MRALYTFVSNKSLGKLLHISPKNFTSVKTFNLVFSYIDVWVTDQNYKPLETENKVIQKQNVIQKTAEPIDW